MVHCFAMTLYKEGRACLGLFMGLSEAGLDDRQGLHQS
jgi:hypothetical protein